MIKSLKKALLLIPAYAGILLSSCAAGVLLYMLYFNTAHLTAGKTLQLFDGYALFQGFFIVMPVILILSGALLSCYRIRHSGGGFLPVIMYALLGAATWGILYPAFIEVKAHFQPASRTSPPVLTAGYFRHTGKNSVYLLPGPVSADLTFSDTEAVVISEDSSGEDAVSLQKINYSEVAENSAPFKDSLIRETIPVMPEWIMDGFKTIENRAESSWKAGRMSWLGFTSFGLILFSVYALTFSSGWRLINIMYLFLMEAGVISFNLLYFSDYFRFVRNYSVIIETHIKFPAGLTEPVLVCINVFFSVLFIFIGILTAQSQVKRNKRRDI
jgi:hypothetical protein